MRNVLFAFLIGLGCATSTINRNYQICLENGNSEKVCNSYKKIQESENQEIYYDFEYNGQCCMTCSKGKPCGNSCISIEYECHQPTGCAC